MTDAELSRITAAATWFNDDVNAGDPVARAMHGTILTGRVRDVQGGVATVEWCDGTASHGVAEVARFRVAAAVLKALKEANAVAVAEHGAEGRDDA